MVEYEKRFNDFKQKKYEYSGLNTPNKILTSSVQKLDYNLAIRCWNCSFEELLAECYQHKSIIKSKQLKNKSVKFKFCGNVGHIEDDCRKKKNEAKDGIKNINNKALSVVNKSYNSSYQLDTGSDYQSSGNKDDLSSYSTSRINVQVASGDHIRAVGHGNLNFYQSMVKDMNFMELHTSQAKIISFSPL